MSENNLTVEDGMVVTLSYRLTVDGKVIEDSESEDGEPISFILGAGQILPALEEELVGMQVGDRKQVTLQPEDGYGDIDPEDYEDFERGEFPDDIPLQVGQELVLSDDEGEDHYAVIENITDKHVRLNFNHALAGKTLDFAVHITALRHPTPDELDHGHVHDGHDHEE